MGMQNHSTRSAFALHSFRPNKFISIILFVPRLSVYQDKDNWVSIEAVLGNKTKLIPPN